MLFLVLLNIAVGNRRIPSSGRDEPRRGHWLGIGFSNGCCASDQNDTPDQFFFAVGHTDALFASLVPQPKADAEVLLGFGSDGSSHMILKGFLVQIHPTTQLLLDVATIWQVFVSGQNHRGGCFEWLLYPVGKGKFFS